MTKRPHEYNPDEQLKFIKLEEQLQDDSTGLFEVGDDVICIIISYLPLRNFKNFLLTCKYIEKFQHMKHVMYNRKIIVPIDFESNNKNKVAKLKSIYNIEFNCDMKIHKDLCSKLTHIYRLKISDLYIEDTIYFENLHTLIITRGMNQLNNAILEKMNKLKKLKLYQNHHITDEGLIHLKNLESLALINCFKITNNGLKHVDQVTSLTINRNGNIDDVGISYFKT